MGNIKCDILGRVVGLRAPTHVSNVVGGGRKVSIVGVAALAQGHDLLNKGI